jgi:dGTPase
LIPEPYEATIEHRATLRSLTSELISRYVLGAAPNFEAPFRLREPDSKDDRLVEIQPEAERELIMLKQLTWFYVIQRPSLAGQQTGQRRVVEDLFSIFYNATKTVVTRDVLPASAKQLLEREMENPDSEPDEELRCRISADVVSGLSEQQAIGLHSRFTGVEPGSILLGIAP